MARPLRLEFEGAYYHITSRGDQRGKIFFDVRDRERFLEILKRTKERYGYLLHAYALMDNHYHLFIETPKANLSQIMQNINTSYTVYVNKRHKRYGHLFQGRFKGIIVDKDTYLMVLTRYIHLNPVRAGIVKRPEDYRWTSYMEYIGAGKEKELLVDITETLSCFSKTKGTAMKAYREFINDGIGEEDNPLEDVEAGIVVGSNRFKDLIRKLLQKRKPDEEIPQLKRLREKIPIDRIIKVCCDYYGKNREELLTSGKAKNERRTVIYLSKILSNVKNIEIGRYFGIKGSTVSESLKGVEDRMKRDEKLRKEIEVLKGQLVIE
ncbi:MAG: Chromosomal replication initiator protein DnaA [Candidatus Scalindua arabica]|uniref:Chromosomal replication initiator protein DnaA n=1 Tax=Candidatus Scalindua arabica TaxID=1127984 RepID=A0A941W6D4_9BACT|nr:Chromosomal replication initiator protein DnaA [Candidatus Scalindua arabica]